MSAASDQLQEDVRRELADDPRILDVEAIAVDAHINGYVTLRGTVGSFAQLHAAVADARRVPGVAEVADELQVRLLDRDRRADAEIRGAALQRLIWDAELPAGALDVRVNDGWVTLSGRVDHQFQSARAFDHAAGLYGVTGVTNDIEVIEQL
jgi:osmotically-inducible protein OsmY